MNEISSIDLIEFFKFLGLNKSKFLDNGKILDIYTILGIKPAYHEDGTRVLTPYELIGIPPQFDENGNERPIIFFTKNNKCGKIVHGYKGECKTFFAKTKKVRDRRDTLDTLKREYKRALMMGDDVRAQEIFNMIESISPKEAEMLLGSFYIYTRFYRRMQQQLLIDLFAHFLLVYIRLYTSGTKNGIADRSKIYRPFRGLSGKGISQYERHDELDGVLIDISSLGIKNLKKVVVNVVDEEQDKSMEHPINPKIKFDPLYRPRPKMMPNPKFRAQQHLKRDALSRMLDNLAIEKKAPPKRQAMQPERDVSDRYNSPSQRQQQMMPQREFVGNPKQVEIKSDIIQKSQIMPQVNPASAMRAQPGAERVPGQNPQSAQRGAEKYGQSAPAMPKLVNASGAKSNMEIPASSQEAANELQRVKDVLTFSSKPKNAEMQTPMRARENMTKRQYGAYYDYLSGSGGGRKVEEPKISVSRIFKSFGKGDSDQGPSQGR